MGVIPIEAINLIAANAPLSFWILDSGGIFLWAVGSAFDLHPKPVLGRSVWEAHRNESKILIAARAAIAGTPSRFLTEFAGHWFEVVYAPWADGAIGVAWDCTETELLRRRLAAALDSSQDQDRGGCELAELLPDAIAAGELRLYYQPIYRLQQDEELAGFEALARWTRNGEEIPPAVFVDQAERCGTILPLCEWVIRTAIAQLAAWQPANPDLWIAVNISPVHLHRSQFPSDLLSAARAGGVKPGNLHLEVTETQTLQQSGLDILSALASRQFFVGVDDFGTGYSNLRQLSLVSGLGFIKIDRSLLPDTVRDRRRVEILKMIVTLANSLDLETVLEGIETDEQRAIALVCGVQYGQGWLWYPALPPDKAEELL